ncbi:MAG: hypothetical protein ACKO0M_10865 [Cyanobium sp.]
MDEEPRPRDRRLEEDDTVPGMPGTGWPRHWLRLPSWVRSELLHEWIRSGGILIAAIWGVYTFVWQDILVPSWQPAHLNLEISLTPVADRAPEASGREMTLEVKATNSSSRIVYPLANYWMISALLRQPRAGATSTDDSFSTQVDQALRRPELLQAERAVSLDSGPLLASGRLFDDDEIQPGASVLRTVLVRIPAPYDALDVRAVVPLLSRRPDGWLFGGRRLGWGLSSTLDPVALLCPRAEQNSTASPAPCTESNLLKIDRQLQQFDRQKTVIVQDRQIGLPTGSGSPPAATP